MKNSLPTPELFSKFLDNRSNAAELEMLFKYFGTADEAELKTLIIEELEQDVVCLIEDEDARLASIHSRLSETIFGRAKTPILHRLLYSRAAKIAAILFIVVSAGLLIYRLSNTQTYTIVPGRTLAALTVNGIATKLQGQKAAVLFQSKGVSITTKADGTIVYAAYNADAATASKMNTLETPGGGEYRVALSDGSIVMLNSGSKLSFPTGFRGAEREVNLEGEAFFEVAKNADKPFIVHVNGSAIRVLGTKFNVSNYKEENGITATLLEGSIRFTNENNRQVTLHPNQQIKSNAGKLTVKNVDAADYMAWTKGEFLFNDVPLATVMQKLGRWYNVEVDVESLPDKNLYLKISRNSNITELLKILSKATNQKFELEGNKILLKE